MCCRQAQVAMPKRPFPLFGVLVNGFAAAIGCWQLPFWGVQETTRQTPRMVSRSRCARDPRAPTSNGHKPSFASLQGLVRVGATAWVNTVHGDFDAEILTYEVEVEASNRGGCRFIWTPWLLEDKGSWERPQSRARWVAREFRGLGGDGLRTFGCSRCGCR